ncbi:PRD domain-containing protein [Wukongibacter sp. M2B1]|uniref:PRD domain-containing protein n=1 Tax=Wukongibacter sp. M2B1 TaxID=3088895 RepID=UPI003D7B60F5
MSEFNFRILKVLNNNIILAYDFKNKKDTILIGKGIGFGKKENKKVYINTKSIQRSFAANNEKMQNEYFRLVNQIDPSIIEVCEKIIDIAEGEMGELNSHIHILLTDHISFALERVKMGMRIENPFIDEIKILYKNEFDIAMQAIEMIRTKLGIDLGFEEIGFIAMHLHSARKNVNVKETMRNTRMLNEITNIIEEGLNLELDKTKYNYRRLINHLQGALDRINTKKFIENPLLENIKKEFKDSFEIIKAIKVKLEEEYEMEIPEQELGYMAIHIERLKTK